LGPPVVCSKLFEMPDRVADARLTFDPFSGEDMAEKICGIWYNERLRDELALKVSKTASILKRQGIRSSVVRSHRRGVGNIGRVSR